MTDAGDWWLYLVRSADGSLYTGISTDPERRLMQHKREIAGGARALLGKKSLSLVFKLRVGDRSFASRLEYRMKRLRKPAKEAIVQSQPGILVLQRILEGDLKSDD